MTPTDPLSNPIKKTSFIAICSFGTEEDIKIADKNTKALLALITEGWKILSAVGTRSVVQYILVKEGDSERVRNPN